MSIGVRGPFPVLALLVVLSVIVDAASTPSSARSELQLELGELLFQDERHWEAISVFGRAKEGGTPDQIERASGSLLRSLLLVAEFNRAYEEARFLEGLNPQDPERRALYGDGLWSYGLFDEAEATYRDVAGGVPVEPGCTPWHGAEPVGARPSR